MNKKEILENLNKALRLNSIDRDLIIRNVSNHIGYFDKADRYWLRDEYHTESSRLIRTTSRAFAFSLYKHIFTTKYLKQVTSNKALFADMLNEELNQKSAVEKKFKI